MCHLTSTNNNYTTLYIRAFSAWNFRCCALCLCRCRFSPWNGCCFTLWLCCCGWFCGFWETLAAFWFCWTCCRFSLISRGIWNGDRKSGKTVQYDWLVTQRAMFQILLREWVVLLDKILKLDEQLRRVCALQLTTNHLVTCHTPRQWSPSVTQNTSHSFVLPSDTSTLRGLILVDFVDGTWSGIWPSDTQTEWLLVIARFISINLKHEQARRAFKKYHINWIVEVRQIYAWFYATVASNRSTSLHNLDANGLL